MAGQDRIFIIVEDIQKSELVPVFQEFIIVWISVSYIGSHFLHLRIAGLPIVQQCWNPSLCLNLPLDYMVRALV